MKDISKFDDIISHNGGFSSLTGNSIVLDFYADWCAPCKVATPEVEVLSKEMKHVDFLKVDVEKHPELAAEFAIKAVPTFVVITPDAKIAVRMGWTSLDDFKKFVDDSITTEKVD